MYYKDYTCKKQFCNISNCRKTQTLAECMRPLPGMRLCGPHRPGPVLNNSVFTYALPECVYASPVLVFMVLFLCSIS